MSSFYSQTEPKASSESLQKIINFKLFLIASLGGITIGAAVAGVRIGVGHIQTFFFGTNINAGNTENIEAWRIILITFSGGILLGFLLIIAGRFNRLAIVDPVEANALKGGKMSLADSLTLVGLSIFSISIGGSVGFEAAMTQLGAGLLSFVGQKLNLERRELRILVSSGTGAGLAAIFGAPLGGTFYALELVVGGYAMRALMPTLLASSLSSLVIYILIGYQPIFPAYIAEEPTLWHFPLAIILGFAASLVGIAVMRGTTGFESLLIKANVSAMLRPAIGGLLLGIIAIMEPQVMGPSHGGINMVLAGKDMLTTTALLLIAKVAAAIVCVGSGFRGGLFSASLFLGAALGCIIHGLLVVPLFGQSVALDLSVVAAMAGVAASIIGTPVAIILLMVETAGLNSGVVTTAITVIIASYLTKRWFGFSFSTWRFHIRGSDLSGPRDIGRLRALEFSDMTLKNPPRISLDMSPKSVLTLAINANVDVVAAEKLDGHFLGLISRPRLAEELTNSPLLSLFNVIEKPLLCVRDTDCLIDYVDMINENTIGKIAVFDKHDHLLGLTSEVAILCRYLNEILAADHDEVGG